MNAENDASPDAAAPVPVVSFESPPSQPRGARPWWVYAIVGLYVLLVATLLL